MKKLTAVAFLIFGAPLWWWSYWKIDSWLPIDISPYISKPLYPNRDQPAKDSFAGLMVQAKNADNRRLFKLLKGFPPITIHRPGAEIVAKVPGDLAPYAQNVGSTDDADYVLQTKATQSGNTALLNLLQRTFTNAINLKGYYPGGDRSARVPGDIATRFDWNAQGDQKVQLWDGHHVTLSADNLQELIRRKKALIEAGVIEAPAPTQEEIEADARGEAAFPPRIQLEQRTPYFSLPPDQYERDRFQQGILPAGTVIGLYEVSLRGRACRMGEESSGLTGWIDAPSQGCGLSVDPPPRRPATTVALPASWISDSDKNELESRGQQIEDAIAHPVDPKIATTLGWSEQYTLLFAAAFTSWCVIGLLTSAIRDARLRKYRKLVPSRAGYGVADFGVPHCRYERTTTGFTVTLRNNNYGVSGCLLSMLTVPALGVLYYFFGGLSTLFLVILTITIAAIYFSYYRAPSRIEVAGDTITINGKPLEREHFGSFNVHARSQLGYQYGLRNYWLAGGWNEVEVTEIASALNMHIAIAPASPTPQPSPDDLRNRRRPSDF